MHPNWVFNYLTHGKFKLANVAAKTDKGTNIAKSVIEYINEQYDPSMNWKDAEYCVKKWNGPFALKGVMSVEDAKKAIDIGCTAIMISNHGGRQLDGSRSPFDQVKAISDAVGDKLEKKLQSKSGNSKPANKDTYKTIKYFFDKLINTFF